MVEVHEYGGGDHELLFGGKWLESGSQETMRYRAFEFRTTGVHAAFHRIVESGRSSILGKKMIRYIHAGEQVKAGYPSFLLK